MIKIFVSTKETQGREKDDFCFVPENEILMLSMQNNALIGIDSRKGTTTFKVIEMDIKQEELAKKFWESEKTAYPSLDNMYEKDFWLEAKEIIKIANRFQTNSIVSIGDNGFYCR